MVGPAPRRGTRSALPRRATSTPRRMGSGPAISRRCTHRIDRRIADVPSSSHVPLQQKGPVGHWALLAVRFWCAAFPRCRVPALRPEPAERAWGFPLVSLERWLGLSLSFEDDALVAGIHHHGIPRTEAAPQELIRQLVFDQPLDRPPQRPRPKRGIEPFLGPQVLGRRGQLQLHVLPAQLALNPGDEDVHDGLDLIAGEGPEDDDLVDAVQELRPEPPPTLLGDVFPHARGSTVPRLTF